jgi:uncharacterized protein (UPF0332 family)
MSKDLFECERDFLKKKIVSEFDKSQNPEIIREEIAASDYDLESARRDLGLKDYKWAIVKGYYSMLHAAKAYVRSEGFIITDYRCTYLYLEKSAKNGEFDARYALGYKSATEFPLDADYGQKYDESTANAVLQVAADFDKKMKEIMGKPAI